MSNYWNKYLLTSILLFLAIIAIAQPKDNSPYSRLGLGDFEEQNFSALASMGGISAAYHDPYNVNILNPASYSHLRSTAFEVGIFGQYGKLESNSASIGVWSGNLSYFSVAFPMRNPVNEVLDRKPRDFHWGMNLALLPFSTVSYDVLTTQEVVGIDTVENQFQGTGGTYKFLWGNGFKYKNLSFGVNLGFLFGRINNERVVSFRNLDASYRDNLNDDISINGFIWNFGAMYDYRFKKPGKDGKDKYTGKVLTLGLYGNSNTSFSTSTDVFYLRQNIVYNDIDTFRINPELEGEGTLPAEFSIGVLYSNGSKYRLGASYKTTQWSNYENEAKVEELKNSWRFGVGGEFIPDINSYNSYGKKIRYRFGLFYAKDPRSDTFNEQLTNYGITLGFGLPLIQKQQRISFVNIGLELGQIGTADSLRETYGKVTIGFTLNDNTWFYKRKFN